MITAYTDFKNIPSNGIYNTIRCKKGDKDVVLKQLREPYASQAKYKSVQHKEYTYGKKIDSPYVVKYLGEEDLQNMLKLALWLCIFLKDIVMKKR